MGTEVNWIWEVPDTTKFGQDETLRAYQARIQPEVSVNTVYKFSHLKFWNIYKML